MNQVADVGVCSLWSNWWWKWWSCDRTQQYCSVFLASTIHWHMLILGEPHCWRFVSVPNDNLTALFPRNTHSCDSVCAYLVIRNPILNANNIIVIIIIMCIFKLCLLQTWTQVHYNSHEKHTNHDQHHTLTHTHNWPSWTMSRTTRESQHQEGETRKVKPIWIYWSKR